MSDCSCHAAGNRLATIVTGEIERPLYAPGLILQDSDLTAAVDYTRDLNRLLFRTLFGCGVVCGLTVSVREHCGLIVTVAPGLALDGCGDPLQLPGPAMVKLEERDGVLVTPDTQGSPKQQEFWVVACAKERRCAPRSLVCDDSLDDIREATRARAATEISIVFAAPECACAYDGTPQGTDDTSGNDVSRTNAAGAPAGVVDTQPGTAQSKRESYVARQDDANCPADCGCGSACDCGCCVLLAKAHWSDGTWVVQHAGVRRFVRPQLIADPLDRDVSTKV